MKVNVSFSVHYRGNYVSHEFSFEDVNQDDVMGVIDILNETESREITIQEGEENE